MHTQIALFLYVSWLLAIILRQEEAPKLDTQTTIYLHMLTKPPAPFHLQSRLLSRWCNCMWWSRHTRGTKRDSTSYAPFSLPSLGLGWILPLV